MATNSISGFYVIGDGEPDSFSEEIAAWSRTPSPVDFSKVAIFTCVWLEESDAPNVPSFPSKKHALLCFWSL